MGLGAVLSGHEQPATDLVTGQFGGSDFTDFHYRWKTGLDEGHDLSVTVLSLPKAPAPPGRTATRRQRRAWRRRPGERVDLESEMFNRTFQIEAADRRYAVDVLNPRTMETMLAFHTWTWRIDGADLIMFGGVGAGPTDLLRHLEALTSVAANIPSFV